MNKPQIAAVRELLAQNPVVTAPMAGLTDLAFREILREQGAGLIYTEMISDMALCYNNQKTLDMLPVAEEQGPLVVQLCGSSPEHMARAALIIEQRLAADGEGRLFMLDINMGCPAPKIVKNGEGCRLMQQPDLAVQLVQAVVGAVGDKLPVSVKMRLGWDDSSKNVLDLAARLVQAGASALAIHGRTREQFYAGRADWQLIAEAAATLPVPIIGNGDIDSVQMGVERRQSSGCAGLMIGRGLLGNPWLARDLARHFAGLPALPPPGRVEIFQMVRRHLRRQAELQGEYMGVRVMRSHLPFYIKGLPGAAAMRGRLNGLNTVTEVEAALAEFLLPGGE